MLRQSVPPAILRFFCTWGEKEKTWNIRINKHCSAPESDPVLTYYSVKAHRCWYYRVTWWHLKRTTGLLAWRGEWRKGIDFKEKPNITTRRATGTRGRLTDWLVIRWTGKWCVWLWNSFVYQLFGCAFTAQGGKGNAVRLFFTGKKRKDKLVDSSLAVDEVGSFFCAWITMAMSCSIVW